ncbi:hypothetical protein D3C86_1838440 [compost metagenome]
MVHLLVIHFGQPLKMPESQLFHSRLELACNFFGSGVAADKHEPQVRELRIQPARYVHEGLPVLMPVELAHP